MSHFRRLSTSESAQLDSARGFSALVVAVAHTNQFIVAPVFSKWAPALGLLAQSAVMVFFVLSGFLIGKSISANEARNNGKFSALDYGVDRLVRIWPPLALSIGGLVALAWIAPFFFPSGTASFLQLDGQAPGRVGIEIDRNELLGALFCLNGYLTDTPRSNGPLWSLSIEVGYYVVAGVVAIPRAWWKLASVPVVAGLCWLAWNNDQFFYYAPVWCLGYGLSVLHDRGTSLPKSLLIWCAAISVACAAYAGHRSIVEPDARSAWHALVAFNLLIGLAFGCLLAMVLAGAVTLPATFKSAASYSYTLYVIHTPLLLFFFGVTQAFIGPSIWRAMLIAAGSIAAVVLAARWSAKFVESLPMQAIKKRRTPPVFGT
uniref:Acyltransferase 3 n=1 Tax=Ralstonia pickettii (strain 12D) TaxID=428406 RepID=C6BBQ8_RALP1